MNFFYLDPYILLIFNLSCYLSWNNNIVDYKCKVVLGFFQNATNPSFFFMLVYVLKKKENIWHQGLIL